MIAIYNIKNQNIINVLLLNLKRDSF